MPLYLLYAVLIVILLVIVYGWFVEPKNIHTTKHVVEVDPAKLRAQVRVLFMSDLHLNRYTKPRVWDEYINVLRSQNAKDPFGALLLGGDLVDKSSSYFDDLVATLKKLATIGVPIYAVLGNHDYALEPDGVEELVKVLESNGVKVLRNEAIVLSVRGQKVVIVGIDELESCQDYTHRRVHLPADDYKRRLKQMNWYSRFDSFHPELPRIMLVHNPDGAYLHGHIRPNLILSGHTHGGQLIFVDWLSAYLLKLLPHFIPVGSFVTWAGRRIIDSSNLIVSRGMGGSTIPVRFMRPPECIVVELRPANYSPRIVIGLSGKPRAGKDTVANMLGVSFPGLQRLVFGNAVKEEYDTLNGTNTLGSEDEKLKHRPRIQDLGDKRRAEDILYWIKKTINHVPPYMITDVRWPKEADAVRDAGGYLIRVEASEKTLRARMGAYYDEHMHHKNEKLLDDYADWDFVIHNNGNVRELEEKVQQIADKVRTGTHSGKVNEK
jgi:phosphomevalonate kinase